MAPFLDAAVKQGFDVNVTIAQSAPANDILSALTGSADPAGDNKILGSRLMPEDVYRNNVTAIGDAYTALLNAGTPSCVKQSPLPLPKSGSFITCQTGYWATSSRGVNHPFLPPVFSKH